MKRILREPLLHFFLIGAALFGVHAWLKSRRPPADHGATIAVTGDVIARLKAGYERQFNQSPDEVELRGLVAAHIREEILSREALALRLERDDTIVRRRLAQKMEFLAEDLVTGVAPEAAALNNYFATNAARYARPARVSFRHVYFSREKRGAAGEAAAREALAALNQGAGDTTMGDGFLHGFEFAEREPDDIVALFGAEFARQLGALPTNAWSGPVASSYGLHLVRVASRSEPRPVKLDEVREAVARDFNDQRRRAANEEVFQRLKQRYQITVDEAAIRKAVNPVVATAQASR
jgi:peptidyl-prolyl cis-trans isomerase C